MKHGNAARSVGELGGGWTSRVVVEGLDGDSGGQGHGRQLRRARKWVGRYRLEGERGLLDRSSRPKRVANQTPEERIRLIVAMRRLRFTGPEIAELLGMAVSTLCGILTRRGVGRLRRRWVQAPLPH